MQNPAYLLDIETREEKKVRNWGWGWGSVAVIAANLFTEFVSPASTGDPDSSSRSALPCAFPGSSDSWPDAQRTDWTFAFACFVSTRGSRCGTVGGRKRTELILVPKTASTPRPGTRVTELLCDKH